MAHHLDHLVASDTSQQVLELRRLRGELGPQTLDSQNRRLYGIPSVVVQREAYAADRQAIPDSFQGETLQWLPVSEPPTRGRRKGQ
jgi:hypothetical protein